MVPSLLQGKPHFQAPSSWVTPEVGAGSSGSMALCLGREDEVNSHRVHFTALEEQKWVSVNTEAWTQIPSPLYLRPFWLSIETPGLSYRGEKVLI